MSSSSWNKLGKDAMPAHLYLTFAVLLTLLSLTGVHAAATDTEEELLIVDSDPAGHVEPYSCATLLVQLAPSYF